MRSHSKAGLAPSPASAPRFCAPPTSLRFGVRGETLIAPIVSSMPRNVRSAANTLVAFLRLRLRCVAIPSHEHAVPRDANGRFRLAVLIESLRRRLRAEYLGKAVQNQLMAFDTVVDDGGADRFILAAHPMAATRHRSAVPALGSRLCGVLRAVCPRFCDAVESRLVACSS